MVELVTASILLVPALVLLWLGFTTNKTWAGLFSGFLFLVFGVLLLGSGFQYGGGVSTSSSGVTQFTNVSYTYVNFTSVTDFYNNIGVLQTQTVQNLPVIVSTNQTQTVVGNLTSSSNFSSTKSELTDGLSVLFIFLGLLVVGLSLVAFGDNRITSLNQYHLLSDAREEVAE